MSDIVEDAFYWVKLKPYDDRKPDWEPMQRHRGKWCRCGVIYRFPDDEVEVVGGRIELPLTPS